MLLSSLEGLLSKGGGVDRRVAAITAFLVQQPSQHTSKRRMCQVWGLVLQVNWGIQEGCRPCRSEGIPWEGV